MGRGVFTYQIPLSCGSLFADECYSKGSYSGKKSGKSEYSVGGIGSHVVGIGSAASGTLSVLEIVICEAAVLLSADGTGSLFVAGRLAALVSAGVVTLIADVVVSEGVILCSYIGSVAAGTVEGVSVLVGRPSAVSILVVVRIKLTVLLSAVVAGRLSLTGSLAAVVVASVSALGTYAVLIIVSLGCYVGSITAGAVEGVSVFVLCPSAENVLMIVCIELTVLLSADGTGSLSLTGSLTALVSAGVSTLIADVVAAEGVILGSYVGSLTAGAVEGVTVLVGRPSAVNVLVVVSVKVAVLLSASITGSLSLTGCGATGVVASVAAIVTNCIVTVVMRSICDIGCIAAGTVEGVTVFVLCPSTENVLMIVCVK